MASRVPFPVFRSERIPIGPHFIYVIYLNHNYIYDCYICGIAGKMPDPEVELIIRCLCCGLLLVFFRFLLATIRHRKRGEFNFMHTIKLKCIDINFLIHADYFCFKQPARERRKILRLYRWENNLANVINIIDISKIFS